jgi:hypothetical protein
MPNAAQLLFFPQVIRHHLPDVLRLSCVLYGRWPTVHSAPRLSPVLAYSQRLLLDAAALNAPSASSCEMVAINRCVQTFIAALALGVYGVAASRRSRWL